MRYQMRNTLFGRCTNMALLCVIDIKTNCTEKYITFEVTHLIQTQVGLSLSKLWVCDIYLASASFSLSLKWGW